MESARNLSNGGGETNGTQIQQQTARVQQNFQQLTAAGFRIGSDGKTMTLPSGKTMPAPSLAGSSGSKGSSDSGGLNLQSTAQGSTPAANGSDKASPGQPHGKGGGENLSGSFGSGSGGRSGTSEWSLTPSQKPTSVSGMAKKFGNDSIGVAHDSIFGMISRRYKANAAALKK